MSVLSFAEDFSQLIMRYMKNFSLHNNKQKNIVPLSNQQITFTVHHVLRALGIKDDNEDDDNDNNDLAHVTRLNKEIPSTNIIIPNIDAAASKVNGNEDNENISQDRSQSVVTDYVPSASDTLLRAIEKETKETTFPNTFVKSIEKETKETTFSQQYLNEKKFISQSNPAICVIGRSDTFIRNEDQKTNNDKEDILEDVFEDSAYNSLNDNFLQSLEEIRESVINITLKIDNLKKQTFQQQLTNSKQLSNSLLNLNHTSMKREPTKIRRSMTIFSGTIPSSKLQVEKEDILTDRRKSIGGIGYEMGNITPKKLGSSKINYSMSNAPLYNKVSPGSVPKLMKNPKYAHVKSTIPKPIYSNKKKA